VEQLPSEKRHPRGRLLNLHEQAEFCELLSRGVSRSAACRQLGVSYDSFLRTQQEDPEFARLVQLARQVADENVEMALYKSAMEGKVTAQTFWLKSRRPEGWEPPREPRPDNRSRSAPSPDTPQPLTDEDLAHLSDRELIERARAEGVELPPEIARRLEQAYREGRSPDVPPDADD
jgi:hypothetical protein